MTWSEQRQAKLSAAPVARYFMVVGSGLAVLLLIAGWSLPEPPASFSDRPEIIERVAIRIRSEQRWSEKMVVDTNQAMMLLPSIDVALTEQLAARLSDEMPDQFRVDPLAKPNRDVRPISRGICAITSATSVVNLPLQCKASTTA